MEASRRALVPLAPVSAGQRPQVARCEVGEAARAFLDERDVRPEAALATVATAENSLLVQIGEVHISLARTLAEAIQVEIEEKSDGTVGEEHLFPLLPIVLSRWAPFTILAVVYIVVWIGAIAYLVKAEDNFNLRKWGEEYRRYMEEVPAINFVKGLRRLRRESRSLIPRGGKWD
jgi:hypothetical protein